MHIIKTENITPDTVGVFETGHFILYVNASEYIKAIQKEVEFCKLDSTDFSKISIPFDSTINKSSSYRYALTNAMQQTKTDIIIYEKLLSVVQSQLKLSDTLYFNKLPPFDKQNFNSKEYFNTNYLAENALYYAINIGAFKLYNKMTVRFEKNIIHKEKRNLFCDYEKIYTENGEFVFNLRDL